ncbi:MAG: hypothetical protein H7839_13795 [Magnetococcus sp. YQC-5]
MNKIISISIPVLSFVLSWPLIVTVLHAEEEIVQCVQKHGPPTIYRKAECQTLDDPTVPAGHESHSGAKTDSGSQSDSGAKSESKTKDDEKSKKLDLLQAEVEEIKQGLAKNQDVVRHNTNTNKGDATPSSGTAGPWKLTMTLVPASGEKVKDTEKRAVINGFRYRQGEQADGGVIKEIARDRVIMLHHGKETVVLFDKTTHATEFKRSEQ